MIKEAQTVSCSESTVFEGTDSTLEIYMKDGTNEITTLCGRNVVKYIEQNV